MDETILDEETLKKQFYDEKRSKLKWSNDENFFRSRRSRRRNLIENKMTVTNAFQIRLKQSCFGRLMKTFNENCVHNKFRNDTKYGIEVWNLKQHTDVEQIIWDLKHNFSNEVFKLLKNAVETEECIDYDFLKKFLKFLRLVNNQINYIDSLKRYKNLRVLNLALNWIEIVPGKNLPKMLHFLELFCNEIEDINDLCYKCPKQLFHLGFGRNYLTNDSCWHLLHESGRFEELHSLDLSNNNINNLQNLFDQLKCLPNLTTLALEGNPCYTCETYRQYIINIFPQLLYLDGTEILNIDKQIGKDCDLENGPNKGALTFVCYRLIGIPKPPKGKVLHNFHLELELPLLETFIISSPEEELNEEIEKPVKKTEKKRKTKKGKEKKKSKTKSKKDKKEKIPKPVKGKGLYNLRDEKEQETKNFKTNSQNWSKIIKFKDPSIIIDAPDNDLELLRDTFRSQITVKIVYVQTFKMKKAKKKKRSKQNEIVLKKSTFATFNCDLHTVNWSDNYVNYIWADSPKIKNLAIPVEGDLKAEIYKDGGKKGKTKSRSTSKKGSKKSGKGSKKSGKGSKKSGKGSKKSGKGSASSKKKKMEKLTLPKILTCHIGFGLNRFGSVQKETRKKLKKKKK